MKECQLCKNCFTDSVVTCPNDGMPTVHTISGEPVLEGKYQIECRLGQGGMGVVYKARHAYLKTQLAIKVILPDLVGNDPQLVTRFRQEALAAAAIRHQNVVSVTDYGVIDGTLPFLVMEYVEGESLHDLLARERSLAPEKAFELISAVCAGVGAAHHQGIVHRDLKPLNIMICNDRPNLSQAVKILDFGLAKIKSGELLGSFIQAQTTGLMGSPYYMAPEQWADEDPDSRSDIYSLGVMLYQMLAGDVPFKGSSIPAIMKKHISDAPPTLADAGLIVSPELEQAVLHTLQKDPDKRTASVEIMVDELREAIMPGSFIHTTSGRSLPVSSLKITSRPPKSNVFVDNVAVGQTRDNGLLLLEGIQSGNHRLRVSHAGFHDWLGNVVCDGKPLEVVAELKAGVFDSKTPIPKPEMTVDGDYETMVSGRQQSADAMAKTVQQDWEPSRFDVVVDTSPPEKKSSFKPLLFGIGGVFALLLIGIVGVGGAYMLGAFGGNGTGTGNVSSTPTPLPTTTPPVVTTKMELISIPGGTFTMGRNVEPYEYGEHKVQVQDFSIGKTEVTNAQYLEFVTSKGHVVPKHWVNGLPINGTEMKPVSFVSLEDAKAYAKWLSQRDGGIYRLPTEQEWEYVARNGSKENLFPWGDDWIDGNAVVGKADSEPAVVGSKPQGANIWGVLDLIGNVYEWTSTEYYRYPGSESKVVVDKQKVKGSFIARGGSADPNEPRITATYRALVSPETTNKILGFRVVKEK
jgi:eukaryotic-like serine/threonine-protein kinase